MERKDLPVVSLALRIRSNSQEFHKTIETGDGSAAEDGPEELHLLRRPLGITSGQGDSSVTCNANNSAPGTHRVGHQLRKVNSRPSSENRIHGLHSRLCPDGTVIAPGQTGENNPGIKETEVQIQGNSQTSGQCSGKTGGGSSSCSAGSLALQESANGTDKEPDKGSKQLRDQAKPQSLMQTRINLVDRELRRLEWQVNDISGSRRRTRNSDGCFERRMGRNMSEHCDTRQVHDVRTQASHKRERVVGSFIRSKSLHSRSASAESACLVRQHHMRITDQQDRIDKIQIPAGHNKRSLEVLSEEQYNAHSQASEGNAEYHSRRTIQGISRCKRLETTSSDLQTDNSSARPSRPGSVCRQDQSPGGIICELETRPNGNSNGCVHNQVDNIKTICVPTVLPDQQMSHQSGPGQVLSDHNYASVADSSMVAVASPSHDRGSSSSSSKQGPVTRSHRNASPIDGVRESDSDCMEGIRQNARNEALSSTARELLDKKLSKSTKSTYKAPWKRWCGWCAKREIDPISTTVENIANYLAEEQKRVGFSWLGITRSAISAYHNAIDGKPVGQHPLIADIMASALSDKPPVPKYVDTWNVDVVLNYLQDLGPNVSLTQKQLTLKVTMLMALVSACRGQELKVLNLENMVRSRDKVTFYITERTKSYKHRPLTTVVFNQYEHSENLDVVACINAYIVATQAQRDTDAKTSQFLISYQDPHEPIGTATIARWLRTVMEEAGVNTKIYTPHSTRSAATSKAKCKGMTTKLILDTVNWSNARTFQRFYDRSNTCKYDNNQTKCFADSVLS